MAVVRTDEMGPPGSSRPGGAGSGPPLPGSAAGSRILIPIVVLSSFITYSLGALSNSDPAATILGQDAATPAAVAQLNHVLGLDKPLIVQYWDWLSQAVRGHLGTSYFTEVPVSQCDRPAAAGRPVDRDLRPSSWRSSSAARPGRRPRSAAAAGSTAELTLVCSAVLDAARVRRRHHPGGHLRGDRGTCCPPTATSDRARGIGPWLEHIILPALALAWQVAADVARQLRTSLVAVLDQNYITGARVRGLPYRRILVRHALRNAPARPWSPSSAIDFPHMLAGAVAAEAVFSLPGTRPVAAERGARRRDIPVVQGLLLVVSTFVIVVNLVVNTLLAWLYRSSEGVGM